MIRKLSAGDDRAVSIVLRDICTSLGALTILVVLLAPEVLLLLTPGSYFSALPAVLPIALAVLPIFTLSSLAIEAIHFSCPLIPALSLTVGALSNLISNVLLIPSIGYIGAGISLLIAYSAANICCYLLLRKKAKIGTLLPRSLILTFFLTASVSLLGAFLYSELFARIVLIPIPVLILLYAWRSAREYLGEIKA
jgi:O-antigen/teichoic acid export membrane protein